MNAAAVALSLALVLGGVDEIVVSHRGAAAPESLDALAGRTVYVVKASSYAEHLRGVSTDFERRGLPAIVVKEAPQAWRAKTCWSSPTPASSSSRSSTGTWPSCGRGCCRISRSTPTSRSTAAAVSPGRCAELWRDGLLITEWGRR